MTNRIEERRTTLTTYSLTLMQIKYALLKIVWRKREYQVTFQGSRVHVVDDQQAAVDFDNTETKWKPCGTHAMAAIRRAFDKPKT